MRRLIYLLIFSVFGGVFYCALRESFMPFDILTGFILGGLGALIVNKSDFAKPSFYIHKYIFSAIKLIASIYINAIRVIAGFFKRQSCEVKTVKAEENVSTVMQANYITLTPGTVTVERRGNTLKVLKFK